MNHSLISIYHQQVLINKHESTWPKTWCIHGVPKCTNRTKSQPKLSAVGLNFTMDMTWGRLHGQVSFKIDKYLSNIPRSTSARERPEGPWRGIGGHYLSEIRVIQVLVQIRYIQMSINMAMF